MEKSKKPLPPLKDQFPKDPNLASEIGFTFGDAGPEKPGKRMKPRAGDPLPVPADIEQAEREHAREIREKRAEEAELTEEAEAVAAQIGPRGNFRT